MRHELDAIGLKCPLPVLKARKRLQAMDTGTVLRLMAEDPAAIIDVPHFCNESGHHFDGVEEADGHSIFLIRKG
mgnify:CR=1 FL=1